MKKSDYQTKIYTLKIDDAISDVVYQSLLTKVDKNKRIRIQKFHRREDAIRCLFADLLIRHILIQRHGLKNEEILFNYSSYGKPSVSGLQNFHFNTSHSGNWIVCAVSSAPVGIDVEAIIPIDLYVADVYFSTKEKHRLFSLPNDQQLSFFFELWTLKESYIKMVGKGMSMSLDAFSILVNEHNTPVLKRNNTIENNILFKQFNLDKGYKMASCSQIVIERNTIQVSFSDITQHFL